MALLETWERPLPSVQAALPQPCLPEPRPGSVAGKGEVGRMRLRPARGLEKGWQEAAPIVRYTQIHPRNGQEACNEFSEEEARGLEHWVSGTDRPGRASGAVGNSEGTVLLLGGEESSTWTGIPVLKFQPCHPRSSQLHDSLSLSLSFSNWKIQINNPGLENLPATVVGII